MSSKKITKKGESKNQSKVKDAKNVIEVIQDEEQKVSNDEGTIEK